MKKLYKENSENSSVSNILYVRHGETPFNILLKNEKKQSLLKIQKDYIDCGISEESLKKINELTNNLNQFNFTYCFVSPLSRCLETAFHSLSSYKNISNMKVFVLPILSEHVSGSPHNVFNDYENKRKKYNHNTSPSFDWIYFDRDTKRHINPSLFYLDYVDNKRIIQNYEEIKESMEKDYNFENLSKFLNAYINLNQHPESFTALNKRCKMFKSFLKNFINENNINVAKENILVFTHSAIIKLSSSKIARDSDSVEFFPNDSIYPKCLEAVRIDLD